MERIAIPIWQGRISPVLDTAERLLVCELDPEAERGSRIVELNESDIRRRTEIIKSLSIHTLLCGALSRPLHHLLVHAGVMVVPWLNGEAEEILKAYSEGRLDSDRFRSPGCMRRRRRGRSMHLRGGQGKGRKNREPL
jgi:predicted Fe-Mo cluster-binding NifX family protein